MKEGNLGQLHVRPKKKKSPKFKRIYKKEFIQFKVLKYENS